MLRETLAAATLLTTLLAAGCAPAQSARPAPPARQGQLDLRADCGAVGDNKSDDSQALKTCLARMQSEMDAGHPTVLRIPAGIYRITGANGAMPTLRRHGGTIQGDGPHASYIVLDKSYAGDLFSWSEAWTANTYGPTSYDPSGDRRGATISGLQITGSTDAPSEQNAFVFYDRNDGVIMRDIEVDFINGQCLSIGRTLHAPQAYMRESSFFDIRCRNTGTTTAPAVEIGSVTTAGSDATNELDFYKLAIILPKSTGLVIGNANPYSATRRARFFGLRVEQTGGDGVVVGARSDQGQVADIDIYDLTAVEVKGAPLRIGASPRAPAPYQISVLGGALGPGNQAGVAIDGGRLIDIELGRSDQPVTRGARAGRFIAIHGNGSEQDWTGERPPEAQK